MDTEPRATILELRLKVCSLENDLKKARAAMGIIRRDADDHRMRAVQAKLRDVRAERDVLRENLELLLETSGLPPDAATRVREGAGLDCATAGCPHIRRYIKWQLCQRCYSRKYQAGLLGPVASTRHIA